MNKGTQRAYRVEAQHFVAGLVTEMQNGVERAIKVAPILKWARGKPLSVIVSYCQGRQWKIEFMHNVR